MEEIGLVFLPSPPFSHLISTVELAKLLLHKQPRFSITILLMHLHIPSMKFVTATTASYIRSVAATHPRIRFLHLPDVDYSFESNPNPASFMTVLAEKHKPSVKEAIAQMQSSQSSSSPAPARISGLFIDFNSTNMIDVGREHGIPTYVYCTSGANFLGLMLYLPTLDLKIPCEFKDYERMVEIPGMSALPPAVMPSPIMNKKSEEYECFLYHCRRLRESDGIIVNTFKELESPILKAITGGHCLPDHPTTPPIYPVGPLLALDSKSDEPAETSRLMEWLDQQPYASVVFFCSGTAGSSSAEQVKETAAGIEQSEVHFLWCLRCSPSSLPDDLEKLLPDGFLERTRGRGLVWQSWVPQLEVLTHGGVGGFVSHCGWNSTLESIWFGVPMLAWPLFAEQKLNAFQLAHDYGLALELGRREDGWVSAEELEKGLRCLMGGSGEGMMVRRRITEMAAASKKALEKGGSSFSSLEKLASKLLV